MLLSKYFYALCELAEDWLPPFLGFIDLLAPGYWLSINSNVEWAICFICLSSAVPDLAAWIEAWIAVIRSCVDCEAFGIAVLAASTMAWRSARILVLSGTPEIFICFTSAWKVFISVIKAAGIAVTFVVAVGVGVVWDCTPAKHKATPKIIVNTDEVFIVTALNFRNLMIWFWRNPRYLY